MATKKKPKKVKVFMLRGTRGPEIVDEDSGAREQFLPHTVQEVTEQTAAEYYSHDKAEPYEPKKHDPQVKDAKKRRADAAKAAGGDE